MLCASVDEDHQEGDVVEIKNKIRAVLRKVTRNSEPRASLELGQATLQCVHLPLLPQLPS